MITSTEMDKFWPAFVAAQSKVKRAEKDSQNSHLRNRYASLAAVSDAIDEAIKGEFAMVSELERVDGNVGKITMHVIHTSGQWLQASMWMPLSEVTPHGAGGGLTYGRRYLACAVWHVASEDDDGNAAMGFKSQPAQQAKRGQAAPEKAREKLGIAEVDKESVSQAVEAIKVHYGDRPMDQLFAYLSRKHDRKISDLTHLTDQQVLDLYKNMQEQANVTT